MNLSSKMEVFSTNGKFLILALDHRDSFERLAGMENPDDQGKKDLIDLKKKIINSLIGQFSGLLVDSTYGLPAYNSFPSKKPFLMPVEKSGYQKVDGGRLTIIEQRPLAIKNAGVSGVKLLLHFNPNSVTVKKQLELGKDVLEETRMANLPLFIEIVTYNDQGQNSKDFGLIFDSLKLFLNFGLKPDVFKLAYPGNLDYCRKITDLLGDVPWIVLTGGEEFNLFKNQLREAIAGGASGFLAGRSLWQDVFKFKTQEERDFFLKKNLPDRFRQLSEIVFKHN